MGAKGVIRVHSVHDDSRLFFCVGPVGTFARPPSSVAVCRRVQNSNGRDWLHLGYSFGENGLGEAMAAQGNAPVRIYGGVS